jgi:hypothetical protein
LLILLAGGVLAFSLSIYPFNWDNRNASRRGQPALVLLAIVPFVAAMFLR